MVWVLACPPIISQVVAVFGARNGIVKKELHNDPFSMAMDFWTDIFGVRCRTTPLTYDSNFSTLVVIVVMVCKTENFDIVVTFHPKVVRHSPKINAFQGNKS